MFSSSNAAILDVENDIWIPNDENFNENQASIKEHLYQVKSEAICEKIWVQKIEEIKTLKLRKDKEAAEHKLMMVEDK